MLPSHVQIHYLHLKCSRSNAISKLIFGWKLKGKHTRDLLFALYGWERFWVRERDSLYPCERVRERECIWERERVIYLESDWWERKKINWNFILNQLKGGTPLASFKLIFKTVSSFILSTDWIYLINKAAKS